MLNKNNTLKPDFKESEYKNGNYKHEDSIGIDPESVSF
jgi:hypothetical protein